MFYIEIKSYTVRVNPILRQPVVNGFTCKRFRMVFIASFALIKSIKTYLLNKRKYLSSCLAT
jgi:hypothetical protein